MLASALVVQAAPQSHGATPMPRMPFAPSACDEFCAGPMFEQAVGTVEVARSPITWIGMLLAVSPPTFTSALRTVPQV